MCSSLKHENIDYNINVRIPVINCTTGKKGKAQWSGFAQEEKTLWWRRNGEITDVLVSVDSFIEGDQRFSAPACIHGIGIKKDVSVDGKVVGQAGTVKILTRPPMNDFERSVHHRWPVIRVKNRGFYAFTPADLK